MILYEHINLKIFNMPNQELLNYIQKKLEKNSSPEEIKGILLGHGWQENLINEAFDYLKIDTAKEIIKPLPEEKQSFSKIEESHTEKTSSEDQDGFPVLDPYLRKKADSSIQEDPHEEFYKSFSDQPKIVQTKKKPPTKKRFFLIVFIILFLIAGGAFAYYYYTKEPLLVLSKTIDNALEIKSAETKNQLTITIDDDLLQEINESSNMKIEKEQKIKASFSFDYLNTEDIKGNALLSKLNENGYIELFFNKTLYGKISNIDSLFFEKLGYKISQQFIDLINNQWIEIVPLENTPQETIKINKSIIDSIKQNPEIVKNIQKISKEKVSDIDTTHYKIEFDEEKLLNLFQLQNNVNVNNCELWINKKDNLIYKLLLDLDINGISSGSVTGSINFQLVTTILNHNKPINAFEPQEPININDLVEPFWMYQEELVALEIKDSNIKSYMDNLRIIAELYKETTNQYSNKIIDNISCDKSLAKTFLEDSTGGYTLCENIQKDSAGSFIIKINSEKGNDAKYCIQKILNNGRTWCIDYAGFIGYEENCDSINFDCKKP